MSYELVRIIANVSGDGNLNRRYIRYSNKCSELRDIFVSAVHSEFGPIHIIKGICNSGTPFVQIQNKLIRNKLLEFHPNYKSEFLFVPDIIKLDKDLSSKYLQAIYDDEGSVGLRLFRKTGEWKRDISISSKTEPFLTELKLMLIEHFGIKSGKIIFNKNKTGCWYSFIITGRSNLELFCKNINFGHPLKQQKLKLLLESYGKTFHKNRTGFDEIYKRLKTISASSFLGFPRST